jgi:hypothetical protein
LAFCAPQIVYSNQWTGQTSALSETLLSVPTQGTYRLTYVFGGSPSGVTSQWGFVFSYTEAYTGNVVGNIDDPNIINLEDGTNSTSSITFTAAASTSITFQSAHEGGTSAAYDVFVVIEQLI